MTGERDRDVAGQTIAMTAVSDLKPWGKVWLPVLFSTIRKVPAFTRMLRSLEFIHFAHWTIIDGGRRLLFVSHYNGGRDEYVQAFARCLASGMRAFWSSSEGFPGPLPVEPFLRYIAEREYEASVFYSAYPDATTARILRALDHAGHKPSGKVNAFTALSPIRPGSEVVLHATLATMDPSVFEQVPGTHFARLVIVGNRLLLSAIHDGETETWLTALASVIGTDKSYFKSYTVRDQIEPGLLYGAYDATVQEVRDALAAFPMDEEEWSSDIPVERLHIERLGRELLAKQGPLRCMHADEIGTCDATMIPLPERPEWARFGAFEDHGEVPCALRYSTQDGVVGVAVMFDRTALPNPEVVSDIVAVSGTAFFFRDIEEVAEAHGRRQANPLSLVRFFIPSRLRGLYNLAAARRLYPWQRSIRNPLDAELCSLQAFDHGGTIVRWFVRPHGRPIGAERGINRRQALERSVAAGPVVLEALAQVQTDPDVMPASDPTVPWAQSLSPLVAVAHIVIQQATELCDGSGLRVVLCGGQGSIGRAREEIYPMLQKVRLDEPTS